MPKPSPIEKMSLPIKKLIASCLNKRGYSRANSEVQFKYEKLIKEVEGIYKEFLFEDFPLRDDAGIKLMSQLQGTEIGESIYLLYYLNKALSAAGDICEFGIAQGATSTLMANEIIKNEKNLWLFDSFEGLPAPSTQDILIDDIFHLGSMGAYEGQMSCEEDMVKKKLAEICFPPSRTKIVPGFIEKTITDSNLPTQVCFAYVDFDFYEPIKTALEFLDGVLQKNGFIIVDDYDFFSAGVKTAVDEFISANCGKYDLSSPIPAAGHFCVIAKK